MIWKIYRVEWAGTHRRMVKLGNVRADRHPAALLRAFRKFRITTNSDQRSISAIPKGTPPHLAA